MKTVSCVPAVLVLCASDLAGILPARDHDAHKGRFGHVLLLGGNVGYGGALILAAQAALRVGSGLVSVVSRQATVDALLARQPECMGVALESSMDWHRAEFIRMQRRANALVIGPGLSNDRWARKLWDRFIDDVRPRVIDADGLNALARSPRALQGAVLTPHPGEAARLLGREAADIQADRVGALQCLIERFGAVVVLKGADTLVSGPGSPIYRIHAGNPGMAVGGMGDVLSGVIAGLLAQGLGALDAARWGALLHAVAGDHAASVGQRGLLPSDLLPYLRAGCNR
ncbi:MAG: NAD(P)H-hydrate dehydratase [Aquimonas sp.]|nr:NAD(P)H-hydrate dehydratase [Aquimonas sp.]